MLQNIGDKLKEHRWIGAGLLGLLGVIFAVWGAYGVVDLSFGSPNYGLKVNSEEISTTTMQRAWQQRQSELQRTVKTELTAAQRTAAEQSLVDEYIEAALVRQRALARGFRVDDDTVRQAFQGQSAFQVDGKYNKDAARAVLLQNGETAESVAAQLRSSMESSQLTQGLAATDFVTNTELSRLYALERQERQVRYALVPTAKYEAAVRPEESAIKAWYEAHPADFQSNESVKLQYASLKLDALAAGVTIDPADLDAWYAKNQARYAQPEKRRARHILIQVAAGATAAADAAALKKAQEVLAQARAGKDFAALAREYSDDAGSKPTGGELGLLERNDASVDASLTKALYALKSGEVSAPVRSPFGYHLIQLEEIQPAKGLTLADSRAKIEADYRRDKATELFGDRQEQIQQKLESAGTTDLAALAKEFGLELGVIDEFTRQGSAPLGGSAELVNAVFAADVANGSHLGGPVALGEEQLVVVKVLEHRAPKLRPLADVREAVVAAIRRSEGSRSARAAADAAARSAQAGGSFETAVRSLGVAPAGPAAWIGRNEEKVPADVRTAAFALDFPNGKTAYRAIPTSDGGAALIELSGVRAGSANPQAAGDREFVRNAIANDGAAESAAYLAEMKRNAKIKRNESVFN